MIKYPNLRERFWSKVDLFFGITDEDCWNWLGAMHFGGYGNMTLGNSKNVRSTHVSWYLKHGSWPPNCLLHLCDNPACVNPSHLKPGTMKQNTQDMISKQRDRMIGSRQPIALLNEIKVKEIIIHLNNGLSCTDIGKLYGVKRQTISNIKFGRGWNHVSGR